MSSFAHIYAILFWEPGFRPFQFEGKPWIPPPPLGKHPYAQAPRRVLKAVTCQNRGVFASHCVSELMPRHFVKLIFVIAAKRFAI